MTIHSEHPFEPPPAERSPLRRLRGRLVAPVTAWTAWTAPAPTDAAQASREGRAGLTVASAFVVDGAPGHVLGVVDPESDLRAAIERSGAAVVTLLTIADRALADVFGYVAPAPGGPFASAEWTPTTWGPRLDRPRTWAGVRLIETRDVGYATLIDTVIEHIEIADDAPDALTLHRGRYGAPGAV